jgi:hypothetical protein
MTSPNTIIADLVAEVESLRQQLSTNARHYDFEVSMQRKSTINAEQNARRKIAYVKANNEAEAKRQAERNNPAFKAGTTRRV